MSVSWEQRVCFVFVCMCGTERERARGESACVCMCDTERGERKCVLESGISEFVALPLI